ncbi:MAG: Rrf2 family transcriptional regulator [Planctomycetes bacterium]|nr:Rrf2 family transcriptional regulator [Planctomycetota bacterium]
MQLTRTTDYALRVALALAARPLGVRMTRDALAAETDVPAPYLRKVLRPLVRAGIVRTRRGVRGGVALGRDASSVTLRDVVMAMEGRPALRPCLHDVLSCKRSPACALRPALLEVERAFLASLALHDLASLSRRPAPA